jgi:LPS sulfotransferase NodH
VVAEVFGLLGKERARRADLEATLNARSLALHHLARRLASRKLGRAPVRAVGNVTTTQSLVWTSPAVTYVICTNPRSGSWLLSEGLASTGLAGNPREWLNVLEEQRHRARWRMDHETDLSFAAFFGLARTESATTNGVSGIKLHYYQLAELSKKIAAIEGLPDLTDAQLMAKTFPNARHLWLTRRDKARQAISLHIASSTREWWAVDGSAPNRPRSHAGRPKFDPQEIARLEAILSVNDSKWQSFFDDNGIAPFVITYEDLIADYAGAIRGVLKWLGAPAAEAVVVPPPRLRRQSDGRNENWLARYQAFKSNAGNLAQIAPSDATDNPPSEPAQRRFGTVPDVWKQWVGHSKLLRAKDDAIVAVLINNGYNRDAAHTEVERTASDPFLLGAVQTYQRRNKGASLLNALGQLGRLDSQAKVVERRSNLSRDEFRDRYYAANRPVIMQNLMTGWKAMTAWTPDYLKSVAGDRTVEVMTGRNADLNYERNGSKHRTEKRFADYIDMVLSGKVTNDYCMVPNNGFLRRPEAQPLFKDFSAFPEYLNPAATGRQCFLAFGPAGTITPLHHEACNVLMAQIAGRKRYRLVPAAQWQYLYSNGGVFSDVECERPDLSRHPKFRNATIIDIVVEPGEVLFMPVGWWHHVRTLDVSMTISFTNFVFPNVFTWEERV